MTETRSALEVASEYAAALAARDGDRMSALRSQEFVLEFVHGDAFENPPLTAEDTVMFWPRWFVAFPELDVEVTRTIAADEVVVTQWIFTGTNDGPLEGILWESRIESPFAALRLRTDAAKRYKTVDRATAVIWKMMMTAEKRFRRLKAPEFYLGAKYVDGLRVQADLEEVAA